MHSVWEQTSQRRLWLEGLPLILVHAQLQANMAFEESMQPLSFLCGLRVCF